LTAHYQAMAGQPVKAVEYIERALALAPDDMYVNYNSATAMAGIGEWQRAFDLLEHALALGYPWAIANADGNLKALRTMPRYASLNDQEEQH